MKSMKEKYKNRSKIVIAIYLILNLLVLICLISKIIHNDVRCILTCIMTFGLLLIPSVVRKIFKIEFSSFLEIMIYVLIFSSEILGEVLGFYVHIKIFDTLLHIFYGFVMAGIGFSLFDILNNDRKEKFKMTPKCVLLFCVCYSVTTGVMWEIFEYSMDKLFDQDMQKDTIITEISSIKLNDENDMKVETIEIETLVLNDIDYMKK